MTSVIVPNYNHALYLRQRLDSILNQTYQDFELIILDDCSKDNSKEIIEQYRNNPKVSQIVYNTENSGSTFKQWHKGIYLAKGEYVWIAESDDWADKCFLEEMVPQLEQHPEVALAFCQTHIVDSKGVFIEKKDQSEEIVIEDGIYFVLKQLMVYNNIYNTSMVIFRKVCFEQIDHSLYMHMKLCGDWFLWSLLCGQGSIIDVKRPMNYFRKHDLNVTNKAEQRGLGFIEGFKIFQYNSKYIDNRGRYNYYLKHWAHKLSSYYFGKKTYMKVCFFLIRQNPVILYYILIIKLNKQFIKLKH